jgi:pimeloyl-ACP methyl ester carboxylesterase
VTSGYTEERVAVRGTEVRILRAGAGPAVLYLHGSGDSGGWLPILDSLAQTHTVYRPDHPGFGHSDDDDRIDSIHDLAFFYLDLLSELGLEQVSIVGVSLGGWIAADLATIEPERVDRLVLVGAAGLRVEGVQQPDVFMLSAVQLVELTYHRPEAQERAVADAAGLEADPEALQLHLRNRVGTAHLAWNPYFHDPKLVERTHRVTAPTLVVWGAEDRVLPPAHGERWTELLPSARLELIADAGHLPHVEAPATVSGLIAAFLSAPRAEAVRAGAPVATPDRASR